MCVGQHGGHYGTGKFAANEEHEIQIADRYYSWGWKYQGVGTIRPMPSGKLIGNIDYQQYGKILIVLMELPRYHYLSYAAAIAGQYLYYLDDLFDLLGGITPDLKERVRVRTYPHDYGWGVKKRISDMGFANLLDSEADLRKGFRRRLGECRLCVTTYNATTYLETMTLNFPTLIYFDPEYWEVNEMALPFFNVLERAGILHYSAGSLAAKIEEVQDNTMVWWMGDDVQRAKNEFVNQFANSSDSFVHDWRDEIKSLLSE